MSESTVGCGGWRARLMQSIRRIALAVLRIVVVAYVGLMLLVYFRQSSYVYYPDRKVGLTPKYFHLPYEELNLKSADGERISAWYIPAPTGRVARVSGTVLYCHGNGGNIGEWLDPVRTLGRLGFDVLLFDYPGYGTSSGEPTEQGSYLAAKAGWDYLTVERKLPADRVVIWGRSLGGAVASWLAEAVAEKPRALVLESTFTSAPDMAQHMFPYLPVRLLCRFRYDTLGRIGQVNCPVLVAHSPDDEMIAYRHAERNFAAAREPKRFVEMQGGHNDYWLDLSEEYQALLCEFVKKAER